ncbi:hypothetical protein LRP50_24425 [Enterovibrio sp. ZSDZ42]|uniref:Uncharacterized protein n=1 Tax=Enterovibrio gelatinilyticus TaxID=2899819 RepID=A0ABT5R8W5_9GAMM|nr:hypothetical protein [Enterovibrio sp. ZSDZ42]MDD1796270.1 hypothetical protein [Enterovibrio sp. ZSDZ42]
MFYVLYFSTESRLDEVKEFLSKTLPDSKLSSESGSELSICDDSFTLRVTTDGHNLSFAREDYGCDFNYCFWFEIFTNNIKWSTKLIVITNNLLTNIANELVLESNGEKPFIFHDSSGVFIDPNLGGKESFPFGLISKEWKEKKLSRE